MVTLQNQYLESKNEKNIFQRYSLLRAMIKVICGIKGRLFETLVKKLQVQNKTKMDMTGNVP